MSGPRVSENVPSVDLRPGDWITGTADGWEIEGRFERLGVPIGNDAFEIVVDGARR
jgi:hypothetical protein